MLLLVVGLLTASKTAIAQDTKPEPVIFTTQEDHQNMLQQLGITKLRPGRNGDAKSQNGANYDEANANPYPNLPDLMQLANGEQVTTPEQ